VRSAPKRTLQASEVEVKFVMDATIAQPISAERARTVALSCSVRLRCPPRA
jgi:hypothetical protein